MNTSCRPRRSCLWFRLWFVMIVLALGVWPAAAKTPVALHKPARGFNVEVRHEGDGFTLLWPLSMNEQAKLDPLTSFTAK